MEGAFIKTEVEEAILFLINRKFCKKLGKIVACLLCVDRGDNLHVIIAWLRPDRTREERRIEWLRMNNMYR